jgi:methylated-DNA-[protein]-cysteine S-methyltransferase
MLRSNTIESPIGPLTIVASDVGVRAILWEVDGDGERVRLAGDDMEVVDALDDPVLAAAARQLGEYFAGERQEFDLPLDPQGTRFQHAAWEALCAIPYGSTVSYGEQARRLGDPRKARAVGAANGRNPISVVVPCHRVVGADGSLTGFAAGVDVKAWLLDHERAVLARG